MPVYKFNPLQDARWSTFLDTNSRASVFHTPSWLEALRRTYGYEPVVYTSAPPGQELRDGTVFCRVESWLTGRRLVSLPFSDYCEPLLNGPDSSQAIFSALRNDSLQQHWKYVEIRPLEVLNGTAAQFEPLETYCLHELDLTPDLDTLFRSFHKDSVQRKIKRAARESLTYSEGKSEELLRHFYGLLLLTRRRHSLPPQPLSWYRNLIDCFGDELKIRVAYKGSVPVAANLTLQYKNKMVFKYGCSDPEWNKLGGTHLVLWNSIQDAKAKGLQAFDLGRSELKNTGLITFKNRWGAARVDMTYLKYSPLQSSPPLVSFGPGNWKVRLARKVFSHTPSCVLSVVGALCYRHIG
jgi:CelD/BcsL family acetyltransferase involved in cellulose biosynthesis